MKCLLKCSKIILSLFSLFTHNRRDKVTMEKYQNIYDDKLLSRPCLPIPTALSKYKTAYIFNKLKVNSSQQIEQDS